MASGFDFSELKKFRDKLEKVSEQSQLDKFYKDLSKEIARDLLALVIPQTPVGQSISEVDNNGKPYVVYNGGTLRRGWTARTEQEATSGTGDGKEPGKKASARQCNDHRCRNKCTALHILIT